MVQLYIVFTACLKIIYDMIKSYDYLLAALLANITSSKSAILHIQAINKIKCSSNVGVTYKI